MGPKIQAAIQFVRATSRKVVITDVEHVREAVEGKDGTVVEP
jgi:carbamate kinase